jgi:hypothetical protein
LRGAARGLFFPIRPPHGPTRDVRTTTIAYEDGVHQGLSNKLG